MKSIDLDLYSIASIAVYPYSYHMLFSVVETHRQGIRLSRDEIRAAEPIVGQLEIHDWLEGSAARRAIRVARLHHPTLNYHPQLLSPMFDPMIVKMTAQGFLLVGTQIHATGQGESAEALQGWWVRFPSRETV